ncbi:MAG: RNA polymerase subunit sigma, partial [Kitasatospora sp.]|nr:RNA polymerase subunit sigma [Kitasatospora sp.]
MATRAVVRDRADRTRTARPTNLEADRDLVGMYLDEIARTPLLDAAQEVELSTRIEAGVFAEQLLGEGRTAVGASEDELRAIAG